MTLFRPVNKRDPTLTISNEEVLIPGVTPFEFRLNEVPSSAEGVKIRRIGSVTKVGTGTGTMTASGYFTGLVPRNYLIKIDTTGIIGTATFKWSIDAGATWESTLVPIPDTNPIPLELGVSIAFSAGTYVLNDQFSFSAEYWTEVTAVPTATKTFQVDYTVGLVAFFSSNAGVTVYVSYEGRGSAVRAEDITQLVDALNDGAMILGEQNTYGLTAPKAVAYDLTLASSASGGKPAMGFVREVNAASGEVVTFGPLEGFVGLTPGSVYYLGVDGAISILGPSKSSYTKQKVGRAMTATKLFVRISDETTLATSTTTTTSSSTTSSSTTSSSTTTTTTSTTTLSSTTSSSTTTTTSSSSTSSSSSSTTTTTTA